MKWTSEVDLSEKRTRIAEKGEGMAVRIVNKTG
jgi:hypothetical protein